MIGSLISKVSDLQKQVEASFEEALHYDPDAEPNNEEPQNNQQPDVDRGFIQSDTAQTSPETSCEAEDASQQVESHQQRSLQGESAVAKVPEAGEAKADIELAEDVSGEQSQEILGAASQAWLGEPPRDLEEGLEEFSELHPLEDDKDAPDTLELPDVLEEQKTQQEMRAPSGLNEEVNSAQQQVKESDVAEKFFERAVDSTMGRDLQVPETLDQVVQKDDETSLLPFEVQEGLGIEETQEIAEETADQDEDRREIPDEGQQAESAAAAETEESNDTRESAQANQDVVDTFEAQVQVLLDFYAVHDPGKTAEQVRGIVVKRKQDAPALTGEAFDELCSQIAIKYGEDPRRPGIPCPKRTPTTSQAPDSAAAMFGSWLQPHTGANLLQTLQGAVDGLRENMEKSIVEAHQNEEGYALRSPASAERTEIALLPLQRWAEQPADEDDEVVWDEDIEPGGTIEDGGNIAPQRAEVEPALSESLEGASRQEHAEREEDEKAHQGERDTQIEEVRESPQSTSGSPPASLDAAEPGNEEFERQVKILTDFYAVYDPGRTKEQIRGIVTTRKGEASSLSEDQLDVLCDQIKAKYGVDPRRQNSPTAAATRAAFLAAQKSAPPPSMDSAGELLSSWLKQSSGMNSSIAGDGLFASGLRTLQTLQGAAEGLRENVERSFDEAIRSQDDTSALEAVQGLREGLRDAVEKAAVQPVPLKGSSDLAVAALEPQVDADCACTDAGQSSPTALPEDQVISNSAVQVERERFAKELEAVHKELSAVKEEKKNLIAEGMRMSKRVHAVEERMKEAVAEARRQETRRGDLDKINESLQTQVSKLMSRADDAESTCQEQRGEIRRLASELERSKGQLQGEQRRLEAEHHAQQQRSREVGDRTRQYEEKLEVAMRECKELRATNASLTQALDRSQSAIDLTESQYQQQLQEALQANEEQRQRLEAVELEFANQSLPYTRRIAELETRLSKQEQQHSERLAVSQREADTAMRDMVKLQEEMRGLRAEKDKEQDALREQVRKSNTLVNDMSETLRLRDTEEAAALRARESAERDREVTEAELRLERAKRQNEEQQVAELAAKLVQMSQQLEREQAAAKVASLSTSQAAHDRMGDPLSGGAAKELSAEARRLRTEVDGLLKQREQLERENTRLQSQADSQRQQVPQQNGKALAASVQLETRFEAALQAIGQLQEELEVCQEQRDEYKKQCHELVQVLGQQDR